MVLAIPDPGDYEIGPRLVPEIIRDLSQEELNDLNDRIFYGTATEEDWELWYEVSSPPGTFVLSDKWKQLDNTVSDPGLITTFTTAETEADDKIVLTVNADIPRGSLLYVNLRTNNGEYRTPQTFSPTDLGATGGPVLGTWYWGEPPYDSKDNVWRGGIIFLPQHTREQRYEDAGAHVGMEWHTRPWEEGDDLSLNWAGTGPPPEVGPGDSLSFRICYEGASWAAGWVASLIRNDLEVGDTITIPLGSYAPSPDFLVDAPASEEDPYGVWVRKAVGNRVAIARAWSNLRLSIGWSPWGDPTDPVYYGWPWGPTGMWDRDPLAGWRGRAELDGLIPRMDAWPAEIGLLFSNHTGVSPNRVVVLDFCRRWDKPGVIQVCLDEMSDTNPPGTAFPPLEWDLLWHDRYTPFERPLDRQSLDRQWIIALNQIRVDAGLVPLKMSPEVKDTCTAWSNRMFDTRSYTHDTDEAWVTECGITAAHAELIQKNARIYTSEGRTATPAMAEEIVDFYRDVESFWAVAMNPDWRYVGSGTVTVVGNNAKRPADKIWDGWNTTRFVAEDPALAATAYDPTLMSRLTELPTTTPTEDLGPDWAWDRTTEVVGGTGRAGLVVESLWAVGTARNDQATSWRYCWPKSEWSDSDTFEDVDFREGSYGYFDIQVGPRILWMDGALQDGTASTLTFQLADEQSWWGEPPGIDYPRGYVGHGARAGEVLFAVTRTKANSAGVNDASISDSAGNTWQCLYRSPDHEPGSSALAFWRCDVVNPITHRSGLTGTTFVVTSEDTSWRACSLWCMDRVGGVLPRLGEIRPIPARVDTMVDGQSFYVFINDTEPDTLYSDYDDRETMYPRVHVPALMRGAHTEASHALDLGYASPIYTFDGVGVTYAEAHNHGNKRNWVWPRQARIGGVIIITSDGKLRGASHGSSGAGLFTFQEDRGSSHLEATDVAPVDSTWQVNGYAVEFLASYEVPIDISQRAFEGDAIYCGPF